MFSTKRSLHERIIDNYKKGAIIITVDPGLSLQTYWQLTNNPLIRIFRLFILLYSHPLTIVMATILSIVTHHYMLGLSYVIGIMGLIAIEARMSRSITLSYALKSDETFIELHRRGVIKIITETEI
ncbi:MAG TPA: hypothetical protein ENO00_04160 [Deltaproteobacteria bacterium]|nr:hypothetical protein [Deltaproteobacteria bacterium]